MALLVELFELNVF